MAGEGNFHRGVETRGFEPHRVLLSRRERRSEGKTTFRWRCVDTPSGYLKIIHFLARAHTHMARKISAIDKSNIARCEERDFRG